MKALDPLPVKIGYRPRLSPRAGYAKICKKLRYWLDQCQERHLTNCILPAEITAPDRDGSQTTTESITSTKRLLHITQTHVYLKEDCGQVPYACLSHCWGNNPGLIRLLAKNEEEFKQGIPLSSLPSTFRDAAKICRGVGIDYLWIDSLCIIQDNKDDWATQSAIMGDIYSNGLVTLAAVWAKDANSGLLPREYIKHMRGLSLEGYKNVYLRRCYVRDAYMDEDDYRESRGLSPLWTRAWVFQERQLSPRVVEFYQTEISWTCNSLTTESGRCLEERKVSPKAFLPRDRPLTSTDWGSIVYTYSQLSLTYESDRLPALAAMAQRFGEMTGRQRYHMGIWEEDPIHGLMWSVSLPISALPDSRATSNPSWSWASSLVPVDLLPLTEYTAMGQLLEANVDGSRNEYLGRGTSLRITLEGPSVRATRLSQSSDERVLKTNDAPDVKVVARRRMRPQPDWRVEVPDEKGNGSASLFAGFIISRFQFSPDTSITSYDHVTFLILTLSHEICSFSGIVLQPNEDEEAFHRVGRFNIMCQRANVTKFWDAIDDISDDDYVLDEDVKPNELLRTWFGALGDQLVYNSTAIASEFDHSERSCQLNEATAIGSFFPVGSFVIR